MRVEAHSSREREFLRQGLLDQGVRELVAAYGIGQLLEDARRERLLEELQDPILGDILDEPFQLVEPELPADDRGDGERLVAAIGETVEAPPDHLAHTLGNANTPALASGEPFGRQLALLSEQPDDLGDEEGIALTLRVHRADELGRREGAARRLDETANVLPAQPAQDDPLEEALAGQLGQRLRERVPARKLHVAVGTDQQQARPR